MRARTGIGLAFALTLHVAGCDAGEEEEAGDEHGGHDHDVPECVEIDYEGCAQLFPAQYGRIWSETFAPSCGVGGDSCHTSLDASGAHSGVAFDDPQLAWERLTSGDSPHVVAGDPACSPLIVRLEIDDPSLRMPPGNTALDERAVCSIATWIAEGATYSAP